MMDDYAHPDPEVFYCETNIPGPGFLDPDGQLSVKCSCVVCAEHCPCALRSGGRNYADGRLLEKKAMASGGSYVLECNELCDCSGDCGNRVVQFGPRKGLEVFAAGAKGLGLRTLGPIARGEFICEYAGEVIGKREAERRARGDTVNYIFVLREHSGTSGTTGISPEIPEMSPSTPAIFPSTPGTPKISPSGPGTPKMSPRTSGIFPSAPGISHGTPEISPGTPEISPAPAIFPSTPGISHGTTEISFVSPGIFPVIPEISLETPRTPPRVTIVDPTRIGNIGRYINHACDPNAAIVPVRIDSPTPRLGVFALRPIPPGGEIAYDYSGGAPVLGSQRCLCGAKACRGYLPFDKHVFE